MIERVIEISCDVPECGTVASFPNVAAARTRGWRTRHGGWTFCAEHWRTDPETIQEMNAERAAEAHYQAGYAHACGYID